MSELFSINSTEDKERIKPIIDTLVDLGFCIQLNNEDPLHFNIAEEFRNKARSSLVFWSNNSYNNQTVLNQAKSSSEDGKLIHILIDNLRLSQLPEPINQEETPRLSKWNGNQNDPEWKKLVSQIKSKVTPLWVQEQLILEQEKLLAETQNIQIEKAKTKTIQQQLEKEINDHNIFRKRNADHINELQETKDALITTTENLQKEKLNSEHLSSELSKYSRRKFSPAELTTTALVTLLIGIIGVYLTLTMPLKKYANETTSALTKIQTVHASTLKKVNDLKTTAQQKDLQKSSALKTITLLEAKLSKLKDDHGRLDKNFQITKKENQTLQSSLRERDEIINNNDEILKGLKTSLSKTQNDLDTIQKLLTAKSKTLELTNKKLQTAETANNTIKKNAYAEIANIKKSYNRELAALRKRISKLQKAKLKPKQ